MPASEASTHASNASFFGRLSARSSFISHKEVKVSVQLLDDSETITHEFKRSDTAQSILDYVCEVMNIKEKDYFGLRYQDHNKHRYWIDLSRSINHISKQFKFAAPDSLALRLRFRFYPNDPHLLKEEITRYQLFVQLQRDLLHGRLYCPQQLSAQLAALVLQSQLGDFDPEQHGDNYVSEYKLLLKQTPKVEEKIAELHREMRGTLTAGEAELEFLEKACQLDTYGFDPYTVKDGRESTDAVYIGVTHRGVLIYKGNMKAHQIPWSQLTKVDYIGKEVTVIPVEEYVPPVHINENGEEGGVGTKESMLLDPETETKANSLTGQAIMGKPDKKRRLIIKLLCPNGVFAKHLWTHILSQQAFFNEKDAAHMKPKFSKPRIPLLSRGSTFRFPSRRVLKEIETSFDEEPPRQEVTFSRYPIPRQEPRHDQPWLNKYHTLPNLKSHTSPSSNNNDVLKDKIVTTLVNNLNEGDEEKKKGVEERHVSLLEEMANCYKVDGVQAVPSEFQASSSSLDNLPALFTDVSPTTSQTTTTVLKQQPSPVGSSGSQNTAQFTVHLIKYEKSPTASPEPEQLGGGSISDAVIGEPLMTSTPYGQLNGGKRLQNMTASGDADAKMNGIPSLMSNGNGHLHSSTPPPAATVTASRSTVSRVVNVVFASFLFLLLLVGLAIALFEKSGDSDWVDNSEFLSQIRHQVYEPARHTVLQTYGRYIGGAGK